MGIGPPCGSSERPKRHESLNPEGRMDRLSWSEFLNHVIHKGAALYAPSRLLLFESILGRTGDGENAI